MEERFKKRLGLWKCQYISKGGRTTLVRSILSSLPIYFLSIFQMPKTIVVKGAPQARLGASAHGA